jgi:hypothetical protein
VLASSGSRHLYPCVRIFVRSSTDRGAAQATGSQVSHYLGPEHRDGGYARLRPCRAGMCGTPQTFWQCYDSGCLGFATGLGKAGGVGHEELHGNFHFSTDSEQQVNKGSASRAAPGAVCSLAPFRCVHSIVRFGSKLHRQHGWAACHRTECDRHIGEYSVSTRLGQCTTRGTCPGRLEDEGGAYGCLLLRV